MDWKRTLFFRKTRVRKNIRSISAWIAAISAIPILLLLSQSAKQPVQQPEQIAPAQTEAQTEQAQQPQKTAVERSYDAIRTIRLKMDGGEVRLSLQEYLVGVLFSEMPTSFELEALKTQAVAARTFTLKTGSSDAHGDAVCADSACCQAWADEKTLRERFGDSYDAAEMLVRQAIEQTDGIVAVYQGALIDAVYFSCSGGQTETAADVWGGEVDYLQSVLSPGEEIACCFTDQVIVPVEEFCAVICEAAPEASFDEESSAWIAAPIYTEGGGVRQIEIGGAVFSGTQIRSLFGLRSTVFSVTTDGETVLFDTTGYGHRVGMSQYGAQAMALSGANFDAILKHYYTGITLKQLRK